MPTPAKTYEALIAGFAWRVPGRYNIGVDVCDRHAGTDRVALVHLRPDGTVETWRFRDVLRSAARLANLLAAHGLRRGDRVAILLPQRPETAIAHVACYRAGLVAVPLFVLFGADALAYRLADSGARALITDAESLPVVTAIRDRLPDLALVLAADRTGDGADALSLERHMARAADTAVPVDTAADDPAVLIYTSGTTGAPKGALHAHRVLLGHLPGVELPHRFFPQPGDRFWTPADWAWIGGLLDVLLPAWHHGVPVVAFRARKFDPEQAFDLMARHAVRNAFLPPTALKMMRQVDAPERFPTALRSVGSGGESLGAELLEWGHATFGQPINEFYGQTECNLVVATDADLFPARPGAMGRPVPGHDVAVVDADGAPVATGDVGEIAIARPDPVMFLRYWNRPEETAARFRGGRLMTGDLARRDEDGYLWYVGRDDDVINSGGYRIGPAEIEGCLLSHPAVVMAAVIGVPDPVRGEAIKAVIVLRRGATPGEALRRELREHVSTRVARHAYPRLIEFAAALPTTATGKILRRVLRDSHDGARTPPD